MSNRLRREAKEKKRRKQIRLRKARQIRAERCDRLLFDAETEWRAKRPDRAEHLLEKVLRDSVVGVRSEIGPYSCTIEVVKQISIQDLKATLSAVVAEAESGQTIIITRHNHAVAQLGPARPPGVHRGSAAVRGRLKPALTRGSKGRYLAVLLEDRGDR